MKYAPYTNIQSDARLYDHYVLIYMKENSGKTPYDFLNEKINELQELIKENANWSEIEEKNKLIKEEKEKITIKKGSSKDFERWINFNVETRKKY